MKSVFSLGNDEGRGGRMIVAIACAIALNEIVIGLLAYYSVWAPPKPQADRVIAQQIVIVRRPSLRPTPPPTPKPRPNPTPRVALTTRHLVQARPRAAAPVTVQRGGEAAHRAPVVVAKRAPVILVTPAPVKVAIAARNAIDNGAAAGVANGGSGEGAGPGAGNGGAGGSANGTGGNGNDAGLDTPLSPCGHPTFSASGETFRDGEYYVSVRIHVPLRNGEIVDDQLHWQWVYGSPEQDPWSEINIRRDPYSPVYLQFPPRGYDLDGLQKPSTVLAIQHTRPNGSTTLPSCPAQGSG
jgi:hypothetical protein